MAENSGIEWTHHTFNPWWGCTKISPACDNCYAESWNKRHHGGENWGPRAPRRRTSESYWRQPMKWNKQAAETGVRFRVFCASLADVFDNQVPEEWRRDLWEVIRATPNLDWLLLTKRPQNIDKMLPSDWGQGWPNVWLGTTVENQAVAERNVLPLLNVPAAVRFLSCEPLLEEVNLRALRVDLRHIGGPEFIDCLHPQLGVRIDWVICGGESGPNARAMNAGWARSLRDQCVSAGVAFLFKQWGEWAPDDLPSELQEHYELLNQWDGENRKMGKKKAGRELDGRFWDQYPAKI